MKRQIICLIATSIAAYATGARAQSSVTLYGIVDTGIAYIHNSGGQGSQWRLSSSNLSGNQWGVKGVEDLGGGITANFQLENGFDLGSGQFASNGREFSRQAFAGLASPSWGAVTLGRQYDPITDLLQPLTADNYSGLFAPPGDIDNFDDSVRFNNAVKWTSPSWGGIVVEGMLALGGVAGASGSGQTWSAAVAYNGAALSVAGGFLHVDNGNPARSARGTTSADSFFNSAVNAAYASARSINIARVGGQYVFGALTAGAAFSYTSYGADAASQFQSTQHFSNGSLFASWMITPAFELVGGYNYTKSGGDSSATYHQANLGIDYLLSKRTDLYLSAAYQHASGSNGAGAAQAVIGSYDVDAGKSSQILAVAGIRHKF
ncbi:porin [Burkholderia sp. A1]|uniref:porin n=1 Tax=Burkholderia sp. A1 TaxID=148446 RepID=UPI00046A5D43|nr:porin [Burkholderia sp. A1]